MNIKFRNSVVEENFKVLGLDLDKRNINFNTLIEFCKKNRFSYCFLIFSKIKGKYYVQTEEDCFLVLGNFLHICKGIFFDNKKVITGEKVSLINKYVTEYGEEAKKTNYDILITYNDDSDEVYDQGKIIDKTNNEDYILTLKDNDLNIEYKTIPISTHFYFFFSLFGLMAFLVNIYVYKNVKIMSYISLSCFIIFFAISLVKLIKDKKHKKIKERYENLIKNIKV